MHINEDIFRPDWLTQNDLVLQSQHGRAKVYFFRHEQNTMVLRHYYRGGIIGKLNRDKFLWSTLSRTRVFQELSLLEYMYDKRLPVPKPIAGLVTRNGLSYQADIVTQAIHNASELHQVLLSDVVADSIWFDIGVNIRNLHNANICHDDINVKNILLNDKAQIFLIDFDKCYKKADGAWKTNNLQRLQRSLIKQSKRFSGYQYHPDNWQHVIEGYHD